MLPSDRGPVRGCGYPPSDLGHPSSNPIISRLVGGTQNVLDPGSPLPRELRASILNIRIEPVWSCKLETLNVFFLFLVPPTVGGRGDSGWPSLPITEPKLF